MTHRDQAGKKAFYQRSGGVMKKANELRKKAGVKIAVIILDGGDWYSYRSEPGWPPSTADIGGIAKLPADFTTQREAEEESRENAEMLLLPFSRDSLPQPAIPQAPMLQAPMSRVPVPQVCIKEALKPQLSLSHPQTTELPLDLGGNDMLNFDTEYFDTISGDFQEVFAFAPKVFLPFAKSERDESFKALQNAPTYEKGMMRSSQLSTQSGSQRNPAMAIGGLTSLSQLSKGPKTTNIETGQEMY